MKIGPDDSHVSISESSCSDRTATVIAGLAIGFVRVRLAERKIDVRELILSHHQTITVPIDDPRKSFGRDAPYQLRSRFRRVDGAAGSRDSFRLEHSRFQTVRNSGWKLSGRRFERSTLLSSFSAASRMV